MALSAKVKNQLPLVARHTVYIQDIRQINYRFTGHGGCIHVVTSIARIIEQIAVPDETQSQALHFVVISKEHHIT